MDEHTTPIANEDELAFWGRHRLALLLVGTILIALTLTSVSIAIYHSSGAAQLDLSRPGYRSVSNQAKTGDDIDSFASSGEVDQSTIREFMSLYDKQAVKAKAVDAFNGDPLNPEVLEFGNPATE